MKFWKFIPKNGKEQEQTEETIQFQFQDNPSNEENTKKMKYPENNPKEDISSDKDRKPEEKKEEQSQQEESLDAPDKPTSKEEKNSKESNLEEEQSPSESISSQSNSEVKEKEKQSTSSDSNASSEIENKISETETKKEQTSEDNDQKEPNQEDKDTSNLQEEEKSEESKPSTSQEESCIDTTNEEKETGASSSPNASSIEESENSNQEQKTNDSKNQSFMEQKEGEQSAETTKSENVKNNIEEDSAQTSDSFSKTLQSSSSSNHERIRENNNSLENEKLLSQTDESDDKYPKTEENNDIPKNDMKETESEQSSSDESEKEHSSEESLTLEDLEELDDSEDIDDIFPIQQEKNEFLKDLDKLPPFEEREHNDGYAINSDKEECIPDSLIRTLINKFLNQRFCNKDTDLNVRSNSLEKSRGFYKWEIKDVIKHLTTEEMTKILDDKYGYKYSEGKHENVPLSFYFDLSGSMRNYTGLLTVMAIELLKKDVKVLVGFNEKVNVQIEGIDKNMDLKEFVNIIENAGTYNYRYSDDMYQDKKIVIKKVARTLDKYLIEKKAEKCAIFSDCDPINAVCNLSKMAQTYWFCFEKNLSSNYLENFDGFIYYVEDENDIAAGLHWVSEYRFTTVKFLSKEKEKRK